MKPNEAAFEEYVATWLVEHGGYDHLKGPGQARPPAFDPVTGIDTEDILSQPLAVAHIRTHLAMLGYGIRHRDRHEITGQLTRLLVAGPGSAIGRYPLGNTGGADISAVTPMAIPVDIQALLDGNALVTS